MAPKPPSLPEDANDDANVASTKRRDSVLEKTLDTTRKEDGDKNKEKKRMHRFANSKNTTKMSSKSKSNTSSKRGSVIASSREASSQLVPQRTLSNRSASSTSDSEEDRKDDEVADDHRAVLAAAKERLTSPSLLSTVTSLTTATDTSGGSSGSNSTITQASLTRRLKPEPETVENAPMSPAVPDPPNVFSFLERDSPTCSDEEDEAQDYVPPNWPHISSSTFGRPSTPDDLQASRQSSTSSSSASSSFHSDASELPDAAGNETDRSTSPELGAKSGGEDDASGRKNLTRNKEAKTSDSTRTLNADPSVPTSPAAAKFAAQMLAAQHRQTFHNNLHQAHQGHPSYPHSYAYTQAPHLPQEQQPSPPYAVQTPPSAKFQHFTLTPPVSSSQLATPTPTPMQRRIVSPKSRRKSRELEKATDNAMEKKKREESGYEALASSLSNIAADGKLGKATIQPLYRKFGSLNHRYLLFLQDELSELEESLRLLDNADAAMRTLSLPPVQTDAETKGEPQRRILPSSRRAPRDRELEYHRSSLIARIGSKLEQYNTALTTFTNLEKSLPAAVQPSIAQYRSYVDKTDIVVQNEVKFLEFPADLVAVSRNYKKQEWSKLPSGLAGSTVTALAIAIAAAVAVPILTFQVISNFFGRMFITVLVAGGILNNVMTKGLIGPKVVLRQESAAVAGVFMGLMGLVALVVRTNLPSPAPAPVPVPVPVVTAIPVPSLIPTA